jgi:chromosome segregation ATPase
MTTPMRPDVAAFRELDALVRNLTDQLAGYRRRALASESRARELEQQLAGTEGQLTELRAGTDQMQSARDEAMHRARQLQEQLDAAKAEVQRVQAAFAEVAAKSTPEARDQELVLENDRLRARLGEAKERTTQLGERIRFLRQQVSLGAER